MVILQVFNKCLTHKKVGRSHTDLGFSDAISIPSKFCYFRPPDHVISMECGMYSTELPVSMYTTKTPIDMCRFNFRSST